MSATYDDLVAAYDRYLSLNTEIEVLEGDGICDPWLEALTAERQTVWNYYVDNGGWEPMLHDGERPTDPGRTSSGRPVLRRGSRGDAVREVQTLLSIDDDGKFGPQTDGAVRNFQEDIELKVDGIVGPNTWRALLHPYTPAGSHPDGPPSDPGSDFDVNPDVDNVLTLPSAALHWREREAWCGDTVHVEGESPDSPEGETLQIEVLDVRRGSPIDGVEGIVTGGRFSTTWMVHDAIPQDDSSPVRTRVRCGLTMQGAEADAVLSVQLIVNLSAEAYHRNRHHFTLSANDRVLTISSDIEFVPGWAASVVKLGASAPAGTGGLLDGQLTWAGYRWMRQRVTGHQYWNGSAWTSLPVGFRLIDANNFCVGFYRDGGNYRCQYGGTWPTPGDFVAWDPAAPTKRAKIDAWERNIRDTWTGKFDLRRVGCPSSDTSCCRLDTRAEVSFVQHATFRAGMLIIADGDIRSNDSLFFLGEPRLAMAAHEFGHHIGNPDEYAGARVDTSLNSDGAVNGIDPNSIMGQNMTTVKRRHYRLICTHLAMMVQRQLRRTVTYEAVAP